MVRAAYTGKEVLSALSLFRPDAVIIDIGLPGVSGYASAPAILNSFTDIRRPLMIANTGLWTEAPDRLVAEQVGFDHFLVKPCKPDELIRLLSSSQSASSQPL